MGTLYSYMEAEITTTRNSTFCSLETGLLMLIENQSVLVSPHSNSALWLSSADGVISWCCWICLVWKSHSQLDARQLEKVITGPHVMSCQDSTEWITKKYVQPPFKTRTDLLTLQGWRLFPLCAPKGWGTWRHQYRTAQKEPESWLMKYMCERRSFVCKKTHVSVSILLTCLLNLYSSSYVTFAPESCRTTPPPSSSASAGQTSAWCSKATRASVWTGGWWSSSGSLTPSSWTPRSPSSTTSLSRTDWSASSPMEPFCTLWGRKANEAAYWLAREWRRNWLREAAWVEFEIMWLQNRELCPILLLDYWIVWVRRDVICQYRELWSNKSPCNCRIPPTDIALCARAWHVTSSCQMKHALTLYFEWIGRERFVRERL